MNDNQPPIVPSPEPESLPSKGKSGRFWQWFWLTFLVVSLAFAWYSFYAPSTRAAWAVNYTTAQEQAVESDKPIILFFTGKWCSPCRIMKREVWADEQVMATVNEAFIPVTIDVDDPNAAAPLNRYRVGVTPTTIITDSKGNVLQYRQGRISKADFLEMLGQLDPPAVKD
ncbi:MAG: thioredoxin family protein [Deltaproteobacteria bacterium]|nr:thioredoxin family protein [Deltaproteobacteria bacterium]RLE26389.1 MAG: thiol:disulfide interchange protein [Acidobacteriota bacterium]